MDFQNFVDGFNSATCIISVEKKDGGYGDIRIVAGNKKFIETAERPMYDTGSGLMENKFVPNSLYDRYLPKTPDFEDKCFHCATEKKTIHTYIHINVVDFWFNLSFIPVDCDKGGLCYCAYSSERAEVKDINIAASGATGTANDVLKTCIKLRGTNEFRKTMNEVIGDIRELCGSEVCTVMLVNEENGTASILAQSRAERTISRALSEYYNMYDIAMSWLDTIGERDSIIIKNEKDMEYVKEVNPLWHKTLEESNVKSIVIFPMRHRGKLLGFIWTTNINVDNVQKIKDTLELTTFFITSEIASYLMVKQLEKVSYTDLLTGIRNRNSMNDMVDSIVAGEASVKAPYGVIFADLNGLKRVNDEDGHSAGDLLLKKAGLVLQEVFIEDNVYRAGGDEFMVIAAGSRESFENKLKTLREKASDPDNVCFSFGYCYNDSGLDIRDAMRVADEEMYKDKEKYYFEHTERKYR